jgi:hypothetical protein
MCTQYSGAQLLGTRTVSDRRKNKALLVDGVDLCYIGSTSDIPGCVQSSLTKTVHMCGTCVSY